MKNLLILLLLINVSGPAFADYEWKNINYYHSDPGISSPDKVYYIINVNMDGEVRFEYSKNGKVSVQNFTLSKSKLNQLNKDVNKFEILELDSTELTGNNPISGGSSLYTMTVTMNKVLYKDVVIDGVTTKKKRGKSPTINIPDNIKPE